jgi:putative methylase
MRIKRKTLEIFLAQLEKVSSLSVKWEQYPTPSRVAANLLWFAAIENADITNKTVLDLGCGCGILALGAAFLEAKEVYGIDIDFKALQIAKNNSKKMDLSGKTHWLQMDIRECSIREIDTIIMNPPFGMRKESDVRDRFFIEKSSLLSKITYSILPSNEKSRIFFQDYIKELEGEVTMRVEMDFRIGKQFEFHRQKNHIITIDLYRIVWQMKDKK